MFKKIAVAIAASPTLEALLAESKRLQNLFDADILLLHVKTDEDPEEERMLRGAIAGIGFQPGRTELFFEKGDPAKAILAFCKRHRVNLLVAGALKKENLLQSFMGSVGRKIIRKARCSLLILVEPQKEPLPFREIVVDGSERENTQAAIEAACLIGRKENAGHIHILKDIKLYGLTMATAGEDPEEEYTEHRKKLVGAEIDNIKSRLVKVDTGKVPVNIKIISGKTGFEISKFARKVEADLVVTSGPGKKLDIFDRIMTHDLEYLLTDIPANLLVVH